MKYKKVKEKLAAAQAFFDSSKEIQKANTVHPRSYHRPGSLKRKG